MIDMQYKTYRLFINAAKLVFIWNWSKYIKNIFLRSSE